jgi:uncharacterized protein
MENNLMRRLSLFLVIFAVLISGCGTAVVRNAAPASVPASLTATPLLSAAAIATPSQEPTAVPTATFIPTATPVSEPMSIQGLRARVYPGSEITIEKELARGANYRRFYASYRSEGLKIYALLTVPDGEMPVGGWPAIVFNHGYIPPEVYRTTERYIAYVDRLARAGYIVFRIDYRGHDQSEGTARGAYGDPGYTVDVLNAVGSLKHFPQANPQKIGMWGHSLGGYLTLRAMVISKDIRVGVIWSGVVGDYNDMLYHWRHPGMTPTPIPNARRWRQEWIDRYGTPEQNPVFWNSISANAYLADLSGPLQLHHSLTDEEVPVEFSEKLSQQVQAAGGVVELYTYEDDNHNLSKNFTLAMDRTVAFFDQVLKGGE